jgi:hypothetical protein
VCGALPACAGFNAAGWLKSSLGVTVAGDGALFSKVDAEGAPVAKVDGAAGAGAAAGAPGGERAALEDLAVVLRRPRALAQLFATYPQLFATCPRGRPGPRGCEARVLRAPRPQDSGTGGG